MPYSYAGTMGLVQGDSIAQRFFHNIGAHRLDRTICAAAGAAGLKYTYGASLGMLTEFFAESDGDPDLGIEPDRVESAFLDARTGGQAPRRPPDRD